MIMENHDRSTTHHWNRTVLSMFIWSGIMERRQRFLSVAVIDDTDIEDTGGFSLDCLVSFGFFYSLFVPGFISFSFFCYEFVLCRENPICKHGRKEFPNQKITDFS